MTSSLRFGLIGTGRIGQVHAASVAAIPGTELSWVADPFIDGAAETARRYGGANVTADPLEAIRSGEVDGVIIASPTPTHVDLIDAAIDAGVPVLCEKPIDLDIVRVDALREKAASSSTPVVLGFNRRFDPHFADLRRRVADGEIGALEQLSITSRDPEAPPAAYIAVSGGIFRDMTIHDFDMARFFVPDIVEVTARGARQFDAAIAAAGDYDAVVVTLRGAGGELITITNSRHSAYGYDQRIEAFGPQGLLQVGNIPATQVRAYTGAQVEGLAPYRRFFLERYADAYRLELEAFADLIRGGEDRSPGFEDGRAALVLADAAVRSAAEGVSVAVDLSA
ncbi:inositol 2-dehydrogenase [Microbacterium oryzae]|uniref:Inositol 2-dehydrogenase n=1 Tax=Microbacterium oryzae TaxID=743009 RepID=A0A6I6E5E7_9MICO|nr:inositol 2-dehydrogenase [Microbacterium oryzae]QGU27997.1 inositol 2-dehydrogenase [Microbacterium oryzae]